LSTASITVPEAVRHIWERSPPQGSAQRGRYGLGALPGLGHRDVDQELLARNEYLATENRILKDQLKGRLMLSDAEEPRSARLVIA
jgi:hypothetical protein